MKLRAEVVGAPRRARPEEGAPGSDTIANPRGRVGRYACGMKHGALRYDATIGLRRAPARQELQLQRSITLQHDAAAWRQGATHRGFARRASAPREPLARWRRAVK